MRTKKILVTGAGGSLGSEFRELATSSNRWGFEIIPLTHQELDITEPKQIENAFLDYQPHFLINCAGFLSRNDQSEFHPESADKTNHLGVKFLTEKCKTSKTKLIHFSTNFVFSGEGSRPYTELDTPTPISVYGKTKLLGEQAIQSILEEKEYLILRVGWLYGKFGKNFITDLLQLARQNSEIKVVTDQIGTPNPSRFIVEKTLDLLEIGEGLFHLSCRGSCSRFGLASFLFDHLQIQCRLIPAKTSEFPSLLKRPAYSVLETIHLDIKNKLNLPTWEEALLEYLAQFNS